MASAIARTPTPRTVADLLARLGNIPAWRVRLVPVPGTATEKDVIKVEAREDRLCELVEGTLVEKVMRYDESALTVSLSYFLSTFVRPRRLGILTGPDGTIRLMPGLVRIPDIAFLSRALSGREAAEGTDPSPGAGSRHRGAQQGEHEEGNAPEAPRVLRGRRPAGLVR